MSLDLPSLLVGGALTLASTAVVQVFLIPTVQRRTRRLERWERDVIELTAAVEEELSPALQAFRSAITGVRLAKGFEGDEQYDQLRVRDYGIHAKKEVRESQEALGRVLARISALEARVHRARPKSQGLRTLSVSRVFMAVATMDFTVREIEEPEKVSDSDLAQMFAEVEKMRKQFANRLVVLAASPRLPPSDRTLSLRRTIRVTAARLGFGAIACFAGIAGPTDRAAGLALPTKR